MNKATLNQIATYSRINTYLSFSRGENRGRDTYGYPIYRLTDTNTGQVFKCMGGGYCMIGTDLGLYLEELLNEEPQALEALATGVYKEIQAGEGIPYGLNLRERESLQKAGKYVASKVRKAIREGKFYLDGACGESCIKRIAKIMGLQITDQYQRATTRKGTDKFLGYKVDLIPEGLLVKYLAKAKENN